MSDDNAKIPLWLRRCGDDKCRDVAHHLQPAVDEPVGQLSGCHFTVLDTMGHQLTNSLSDIYQLATVDEKEKLFEFLLSHVFLLDEFARATSAFQSITDRKRRLLLPQKVLLMC